MNPVNRHGLALSSLIGLACAAVSPASVANGLSDALGASTPSLSLRLRHETAAQDNPLKDASSNTLRHRLGITTGRWHELSMTLESEGVVSIGDEDYNSGPGGNGQTAYSVIADPSGNELNQGFLDYRLGPAAGLRVGRQRIVFDDARFIGNVGWRQNEQTFDAAKLSVQASRLTLQYAYLSNINRIFFDNVDVEGHLLNLQTTLSQGVTLAAFGYLLDFASGEDTQTLGLRLSGQQAFDSIKLGYAAAYAQQQDYADSSDIDNDYLAAELTLSGKGLSVGLGTEILGSDGTRGFSTPLATMHKFNGFADVFLNTPATGLRDRYGKLGYSSGRWQLLGIYHQFEADSGGADYGSEVDAVISYALSPKHKYLLKWASYSADTYAVDTDRLTLEVDYAI